MIGKIKGLEAELRLVAFAHANVFQRGEVSRQKPRARAIAAGGARYSGAGWIPYFAGEFAQGLGDSKNPATNINPMLF